MTPTDDDPATEADRVTEADLAAARDRFANWTGKRSAPEIFAGVIEGNGLLGDIGIADDHDESDD